MGDIYVGLEVQSWKGKCGRGIINALLIDFKIIIDAV